MVVCFLFLRKLKAIQKAALFNPQKPGAKAQFVRGGLRDSTPSLGRCDSAHSSQVKLGDFCVFFFFLLLVCFFFGWFAL